MNNKIDRTPVFYTSEQMDKITDYIREKYGNTEGYTAHEIQSAYVHTDTLILDPEGQARRFVTFGMGARAMNSPSNFVRTELVMFASPKIGAGEKESFAIAGELVRVSKFPFRENVWVGPGHTMDTSKEFEKMFGYDYVAFCDTTNSVCLPEIDEAIHFLALVPIYKEEREWCVENSTFALLDKLYEKYGENIFNVDFKRDILLPQLTEKELEDYKIMNVLGICKETYERLCAYIDQCDEVTYEKIEKWIIENR